VGGAVPNYEVSFICTRCNKYDLASELFLAVVAFVLLVLESITNVFAPSLTRSNAAFMLRRSVHITAIVFQAVTSSRMLPGPPP
jgi:hypothetical protein